MTEFKVQTHDPKWGWVLRTRSDHKGIAHNAYHDLAVRKPDGSHRLIEIDPKGKERVLIANKRG